MQRKAISVFTLAMINVAAICSIRNWPLVAVFGFASLFYYTLGSLCFFIPCALVSAELASAWPERGGVFVWVKKALGHKLGFLAVWLLWAENLFYYPTILSFVAAGIAYVIKPMLANNATYTFFVIFFSFWIATLLNLRGMKTAGWVSTICALFGTIIPGILIIGLGMAWWGSERPMNVVMNWDTLIPKVRSASDFSLLAGMVLGFAGIEMSAVHAKDVQNAKKNYPRAIGLSALVILVLSVLGTLAISIVIPADNIHLSASAIEAITIFMKSYGLGWLGPVIACLITIGAFGTMSTWTVGPIRGLLAAADEGDFPPFFHRVNKWGMPSTMMILQAIVVSIAALLFLYSSDINASYWKLLVLCSQLYIIMYALLFLSGIVLKYRFPDKERPYAVPGGRIGMWIVSGTGFLSMIFCLIVGFFPPTQVDTGSLLSYELFLWIGILFFCAIPFVLLRFKKKSWAKT